MSQRAWTVPSAYAAAAIVAGFMLPRLENLLFPQLGSAMSVPAAMAVYSSVASGMITLTGIVFSLVFVMVQFSATAYSPRLVLWVARTPAVAHTLGIFSATFLYALAALAWVDRGGRATVPLLSAMVVLALLLASVAMFIGLIERVGLLRVNRMLMFMGRQGRGAIAMTYTDRFAPDAGDAAADQYRHARPTQTVLHYGEPAAVQRIDVERLVEIARRADAVIIAAHAVGDALADSTPLARVTGATPLDDREIRRAFVLGSERTFEQDPKYALRLLVDVAIRALSAAINDPTTAVQALDQIGDLLMRLSGLRLDVGCHRDAGGAVRLVVPVPDWEDYLALSFDEIQAYGSHSVQVVRRLRALLADLHAAAPEARRPPLLARQARLERLIAQAFPDRDDRHDASAADRQGLGVSRRPAA